MGKILAGKINPENFKGFYFLGRWAGYTGRVLLHPSHSRGGHPAGRVLLHPSYQTYATGIKKPGQACACPGLWWCWFYLAMAAISASLAALCLATVPVVAKALSAATFAAAIALVSLAFSAPLAPARSW